MREVINGACPLDCPDTCGWQIEVEAYFHDNDEVFRFIERVASIEGVTAVDTAIVARTEKFNFEAEGEWMDAHF